MHPPILVVTLPPIYGMNLFWSTSIGKSSAAKSVAFSLLASTNSASSTLVTYSVPPSAQVPICPPVENNVLNVVASNTNPFFPTRITLVSNSRTVELYSGDKAEYVSTLKGVKCDDCPNGEERFTTFYSPETPRAVEILQFKCLSLRPKGCCSLSLFSLEFSAISPSSGEESTSPLHSHLDANGLADVESSDEEKKLMKRRISKLEGEVSLLRRQMDQMQSMMIMSMRNFSASSAESLYPRAESLYPPRPQQRLTLVFVYGTLKRGFFNYEKFLSDQAAVGGTADFIDTCTTVDKRRLCICDFGVPAIIDDALGNGIGGEGKRVKGEIFAVDDEKLLVLDKLEGVGVEGWCSYERKPISVVRSDGEEVEVEFYLLVGAEEGSEVFSRMMNRVKDEGGFLESYTKAIHDAEYKPRAERGEA